MPVACYCDEGRPEVFQAQRPIARTRHRCCECCRQIQPGERYERVSGRWDGAWDRFATCCYCLAIRGLLMARMDCYCHLYGGLYEDLFEWSELDWPPGLKFAVRHIELERRHATPRPAL